VVNDTGKWIGQYVDWLDRWCVVWNWLAGLSSVGVCDCVGVSWISTLV